MLVFVLLMLCMGTFINGGLTSGFKEDGNMTITRSCHDKERQALLGLKANLVDINNTLSDWGDKEKNDCCRWVGVSCDEHTGHVNLLYLSTSSSYGLSGNISPLLAMLPQLNYLDLSAIDFQYNPIPNSLSSLSNLRHLAIYAANLSGSIPHELANLSNLDVLDLGNNLLSGPIPHQLSNLSNLMYLDLSNNFLSGSIHVSFGDFTSLIHLELSGNRLEGVIPKSFENRSSLVQLDLSKNLLNGSVPNFARCSTMKEVISKSNSMYVPKFTKCASLHKLDLSRNRLSGNLPISVGELSNLEYIDVSSNSLKGVISDVHFQNLTQLTYLDLSFNSFTLNLSSQVSFQLYMIKMQSCKLGPRFPMWIQTQRDFAYLDISNAGISDRVPGWFWDLPRGLRFLNLSSNEIKGTLPNITLVFGNFPGMDLSNNQLEGTIPVLPSKLAALNLSGNKFSGTLSFLCHIDMGLSFLDLSNNLLSGGLPDCLKKFGTMLVVLNLSNNRLSGDIPSSLGFLSELQALNLRRNAFVGEVPMSLSNCTKLRFMDLGENKLSGKIPPWIGETLLELRVLVLRSNKLNGSLPTQICFLNNLQFLDLSNNALSGNIPRCFGNFTSMASREFQGDIMSHSYSSYVSTHPGSKQSTHRLIYYGVVMPCWKRASYYLSYCSNGDALFIDNALVAWKGTRREFGRGLYLLKSIDLSSNKLYGKLPCEITNLHGLVSLNFSVNKLQGEIPKHVGRLRSLESLDLSRNKFSGNIPLSLSQITPLSYLDLSYNNLLGRIPLGPQLQLFSSSSYAGNPQLCGPPLTQRCGPPPALATVDGKENVEEDGDEFWTSYYTGMGVGFLGICGVLFFNRGCRYLIFASLNKMKDWIYVTAVVHFRNLHKKFRR